VIEKTYFGKFGLINDAFHMLVTAAFLPATLNLIDPEWRFKWLMQ
jgi:hypothetical protein